MMFSSLSSHHLSLSQLHILHHTPKQFVVYSVHHILSSLEYHNISLYPSSFHTYNVHAHLLHIVHSMSPHDRSVDSHDDILSKEFHRSFHTRTSPSSSLNSHHNIEIDEMISHNSKGVSPLVYKDHMDLHGNTHDYKDDYKYFVQGTSHDTLHMVRMDCDMVSDSTMIITGFLYIHVYHMTIIDCIFEYRKLEYFCHSKE